MTALLTRAPVTTAPPRRPGGERLAFGYMLAATAALYLWNQPATENNHTPAWDNFDIGVGRVR